MLRPLDPRPDAPALSYPLAEYFDITSTLNILTSQGFRKIALQFPDELLPYAPEVYRLLQAGLGHDVLLFVLGDTSYGACCVDEVAAQHLSADVVIHYGRTCLSPTSHLPVIYVLGRKPVDVDHLLGELQRAFPLVDGHTQLPDAQKEKEEAAADGRQRHVEVYYDVAYAHAAAQLEDRLRAAGYPEDEVVVSRIDTFFTPARALRRPYQQAIVSADATAADASGSCGSCSCRGATAAATTTSDDPEAEGEVEEGTAATTGDCHRRTEAVVYGRRVAANADRKGPAAVVFVGEEGPTLTNFVLTYGQARVWRYSPDEDASAALRRETLSMNKTLMRRYFLVEKTKDADIIGIVAGTLGVSKYLEIIEHMKRLIKAAGKKHYTFVVGKLNPQKLANFELIDVFVLVACPENSMIDSKEFYKPIVTPYELELALTKGKEWTGEYVTDFREILPSSSSTAAAAVDGEEGEREAAENDEGEEEEPRLSLIDGRLKPTMRPDADAGQDHDDGTAGGGQLVAAQDGGRAVAAVGRGPSAASFLAGRQWRGLEQRLGETEVKLAEEGRAGLPKGYTHSLDSQPRT